MSSGSVPTKRTLAPSAGAIWRLNMSASSIICVSAASESSFRKYVGNVAAEMAYGPLSMTTTFGMCFVPSRTIAMRSLKRKSLFSSLTTITTRCATLREAVSMRYWCPRVNGFAFITMMPVSPSGLHNACRLSLKRLSLCVLLSSKMALGTWPIRT